MADIQEFLDKFDRLNVSGTAEIVASKTKALDDLYAFIMDASKISYNFAMDPPILMEQSLTELNNILITHGKALGVSKLKTSPTYEQVVHIQRKIAQKYADLQLSKQLLLGDTADIDEKLKVVGQDTKLKKNLEDIKSLFTELESARKALEDEKSKVNIKIRALGKAIATYKAALTALNDAVKASNSISSSKMISPPAQKGVRAPSKGALIASNLIAELGRRDGWERAIVTDKELFFKQRDQHGSEANIDYVESSKNVYINLAENECYVVSKVYQDKSTADLIQDSNGAITLKSEKLSDEGKQEQALEAALMAIKNYPGKGSIRINSSLDEDMAARVHVALIALAPHIEVKNFACEKPNVKTIFGNLDMDKVRSKEYLGPTLVSDKYNKLREEVKDILKAKATLRGDTEKFRSNVQTDREAVKQQITEATQEGEEVVKEGLRKK